MAHVEPSPHRSKAEKAGTQEEEGIRHGNSRGR